MIKNFPDTIATWSHTVAADVPSANIFDPDVRVQLRWVDIEDAVERGAIVPSQAHALWALWAASDSPQRVAADQGTAANTPAQPRAKLARSLLGLFS